MRGSTRTSRIAAYVTSGTLALSGTVLAATPAEAAEHDPIGVNQGASWLESQLTDGVVYNEQYAFDDIGLTIDFALGLAAVGGHETTVQSIRTAVEPKIDAYVQSDEDEGDDVRIGRYANATAKALVFAQKTGANPESYGGHNLVSDLTARVIATGPSAGRIADDSSYGDYGNSLGQAYAAHGFTQAASDNSAEDVTDFLLKQQCTSGYFRLNFTPNEAATNQSCVEGTDAPDTDATALAVLMLQSQESDTEVGAAIAKARGWLLDAQETNGSWGGGASTEAPNANSTGLAGWALGDTGLVPAELTASEKAAQWLRAHQATAYDVCDKLKTELGAIAYDNAGLASGRSAGITDDKADQWRRASAQALPAMAYLPEDTTPAVPVLTGPSGYLKAGSTRGLTTKGVGAGDKLCLTGLGASVQGTASGSTKVLPVKLPAGTATRTYRVRDSWGNTDTGSVKVLGKKTLPLYKTKSRVKLSGSVTVRIGGLASRESAKIWYKGNVVRSGKATTGGVFSGSFNVGSSLGLKSIVGHGQYGDIRRGATTIRVVR